MRPKLARSSNGPLTCSQRLKTNPEHTVALQGVMGHGQKLASPQLSASLSVNTFLQK